MESQHPNLYKHYKSHSMECESMLFSIYLRGLSNSFCDSFIDSLISVVSSRDMRKNEAIKLRPPHIHNSGCFETLNLLHVSSYKMSYMKQNKNANKLWRVRSTNWKPTFSPQSKHATLSDVGWETWDFPLVRRKLSLHVHTVVVNDSGGGVDHIWFFVKQNIL